ncbi:Putative permease [Ochrobactrum soli]|uniref:Permease n=1 Tax=Ochrobactrum soli TaxID=2448455 RepID=A0A2P9HEX3_9HYPH|nr:Putative permease [[Ochrobactrum] soli]
MAGFVLQALGAIFAFIGSSYVAARYLPSRMLAIFVGFTQCLGMAGAAFGSKPVHMAIDPAGSFQLPWQTVWIAFAVLGFVLAIATWIVMPKEKGDSENPSWPAFLRQRYFPLQGRARQSAKLACRHHRRVAFRPNHDRGAGVGDGLPARRRAHVDGRCRLGCLHGADRLGDRLPAARLYLR